MRFSALFVILVFVAGTFSQVPQSNELQIRSDIQLTVPIIKSKDKKTDRVSLILTGTLRAGQNIRGLTDKRIAVGVEYRVNPYIAVTPAYVYRVEQPVGGRRRYESRLRIDVQFQKKFSRFTISDRNRLEHRFRNSRSDSTFYRNRLQVSVPVTKRGKELFAPFVAAEPHFVFQTKRWSRNETTLGISKRFSPAFGIEFYYLHQYNRGVSLKYVNAFGVNLRFRID